MIAKVCLGCGSLKPVREFRVDRRNKDGHTGRCKECLNAEATRKRDRASEVKRISAYKKTPAGKAKESLYRASRLRRHPEKVKARRKLNKAIERGKLVRLPCEVCGTTERIEGHHDDYSKPLEARWLCREYHKEFHDGEDAEASWQNGERQRQSL